MRLVELALIKRSFQNSLQEIADSSTISSSDVSKLFELGYKIQKLDGLNVSQPYYAQIINLLEASLNECPKRLSEFSFAKIAFAHGVRLFEMNCIGLASKAFIRANEVLEIIQTRDVSMSVIELRASVIHWLACCQRRLGEFNKAQVSYKKALYLVHGLLFFSTTPQRNSNHHIMLEALAIGYVKSLRTREKRHKLSL